MAKILNNERQFNDANLRRFAMLVWGGKRDIDAMLEICGDQQGKRRSLSARAVVWRKQPAFADETARLQKEEADKAIISKDECVRILADHARGTLGHFLVVVPDPDGKGTDFYFDLEKAKTEGKLHLLEQVSLEEHFEKNEDGKTAGLVRVKRLKLHSPQAAIKQLAEMQGWNEIDKHDSKTLADFVKRMEQRGG